MRRLQAGFTLVEVLIMSPILMVTIMLILSLLFTQYGQFAEKTNELNLQTEAQSVLFTLQDDLQFSDGFLSTASINDTYKPSGGWTNNTSPYPTLIISMPAYTANRRSASRLPVYINTKGCVPNVTLDVQETNNLAYNNVIYFVNNDILYKRILDTPIGTNTCGTSYLVQTCPEANSTASCPKDIVLARDVTDFNVEYLQSDNSAVSQPELGDRATVTITLGSDANGTGQSATSSLTLKKLNL